MVAQAALATALNDLRAFEASLHVGPSPVDLLVRTQAIKVRGMHAPPRCITGIETVSTHPDQSELVVSS